MAHAVQITIAAGNKVSLNYQSQEVEVSVTYQLEREDNDLLAVFRDKAEEVARAHKVAWHHVHNVRAKGAVNEKGKDDTAPAPRVTMKGDQPAEGSQATQPSAAESSEEPIAPSADDASPDEDHEEAVDEVASESQRTAIKTILRHSGWSDEQMNEHLSAHYSVSAIEFLTRRQASQWLLELQRSEREKVQQRRLNAKNLNGKS